MIFVNKVRCFWDYPTQLNLSEAEDNECSETEIIQPSQVPQNLTSKELTFVKEFWKVITKQNEKLDCLLEENTKLKISLKDISENFAEYKKNNDEKMSSFKIKLKKIDALEKEFRVRTPIESITDFIKNRNLEIMNPCSESSLNRTQNMYKSNTEYMVTKTDVKEKRIITD